MKIDLSLIELVNHLGDEILMNSETNEIVDSAKLIGRPKIIRLGSNPSYINQRTQIILNAPESANAYSITIKGLLCKDFERDEYNNKQLKDFHDYAIQFYKI